MKRIIAASAILLSLGTSAFAMTNGDGLSSLEVREAQFFVPSGDFTNLSAAQANAIGNALHGDDRDVRASIKSVLAWN